MSDCYEVNAPLALGEIIRGEAILLHLQRGNYFSTHGSGALIWAGIEQRATLGEIAQALLAHYGRTEPEPLDVVRSFVSELASHDLIRVCDPSAPGPVVVPPSLDPEQDIPSLEVYTDMQDLLLLDPIHGVDEMGWPLPPRQGAA